MPVLAPLLTSKVSLLCVYSFLISTVRCSYLCSKVPQLTGCFFTLGLPLKVPSTKKLIQARLGVSGTIYVNVDSPNLGFPYFNFLGEAQCKKTPCMCLLQLGDLR